MPREVPGNKLAVRRLRKGKQNSTANIKMTGTPPKKEGFNGDIQVRMSKDGPRMFAKLGNQWYTTPLHSVDDVALRPKVAIIDGVFNAAPANPEVNVPMP